MTDHKADALLYFPKSHALENGGWTVDVDGSILRTIDDNKEEKTVAQGVMDAREFAMETMRNAWVPDDMKRKIEKHIMRLCEIIERQERSLQNIVDENFMIRDELQEQNNMLDNILDLNLEFEHIDTVPTMSKLTKQCVDAYNTCVAIRDKIKKDAKDKVRKAIEKTKARAVLY